MPNLMRVKTCEHRGTCGAATGSVVKIGKAKTVVSQAVDVGRFDFTAVTTSGFGVYGLVQGSLVKIN